jgi:hypothetical protein
VKSCYHISKIIIFLLILSCSSKQEDQILNLEKIRPKSGKIIKEIKKEEIDSSQFILQTYHHDSFKLNISKIEFIKSTTFLARFPNINSGNITLYEQDTSKKIQHEFYNFKDSNQMKNAFFNWLDNVGKVGKSLKLYEESKIENYNLLIITASKSIDIIRSNTLINPDEWIKYVRFSREINDFRYILFQKKNQKVKWFEFINYKLVPKVKK